MVSTPGTSTPGTFTKSGSGSDPDWPFGTDVQAIACLTSLLALNPLQQQQQWTLMNTTNGRGILDEVILAMQRVTHLSQKFSALQSNHKTVCAELSTMKREYQKFCDRFSIENREKMDAEEHIKNQAAELLQKNEEIAALRIAPTTRLCSEQHPNPDKFDGTNRALLSAWIFQMEVKLNANADWWTITQQVHAYIISRLDGTALEQVKPGFPHGVSTFSSTVMIFDTLCNAYGDVMEKENAQAKIYNFKQSKPFTIWFPEWHTLASKTDFLSNILVSLLETNMNLELKQHLSYFPVDTVDRTNITTFANKIRQVDALVQSTEPTYKQKYKKGSTGVWGDPVLLPAAVFNGDAGVVTEVDSDPMDLSAMVWPGCDGGKCHPHNDKEKASKRKYCMENKLCLYCEESNHRIQECPTLAKANSECEKAKQGKA
ncbi:hypothetical protein LPUS_03541 [Lasallia pustulata]|uniref:Zinc finger, CCHC-type n=1 Tax=Lasallia pustulata TaxID=136370 RepID=A0A1W5CV69_9LECA|nr:hypothetical protein LPUS_03541 [Lasallia pustulata]